MEIRRRVSANIIHGFIQVKLISTSRHTRLQDLRFQQGQMESQRDLTGTRYSKNRVKNSWNNMLYKHYSLPGIIRLIKIDVFRRLCKASSSLSKPLSLLLLRIARTSLVIPLLVLYIGGNHVVSWRVEIDWFGIKVEIQASKTLFAKSLRT